MTDHAIHRKLAIVSCSVPPVASGQATVLFRLLNTLKSDDYCLISVGHDQDLSRLESIEGKLPARCYPLHPPEISIERRRRYVPKLLHHGLNFVLKVLHRARRIRNILRAERCTAVLGCTGDLHDLPAAYLAARWAGVPFYAYAFDYYSFQCKAAYPAAYKLTCRVERHILQGAAGVIVPNEFLSEEYRRRYRIDPVIVRNAVDASLSDYGELKQSTPKPHSREFVATVREIRLVYTGSVYQAQFDAFQNLLIALETLGRPDVKLHVYSNQSTEQLAVGGIRGAFVRHPPVSMAESIRVQQHADILFLPLAFESPYPEIIHTSAPGKLGEYLGSGRPILAHAPADSYLAWYFKRHECGLIVDRPDPELLKQALWQLLDDPSLRERLIRNAQACAADFDVELARSSFLEVVGAPAGE